MIDNKNYYEVLGVSEDAENEEIKKAFQKLATKYKNKKRSKKKLEEINEAYHTLSSYKKRKEYDLKLKSKDFNADKLKNIVIVILIVIIMLGGSFAASLVSNYKRNCIKKEEEVKISFNNIDVVKYLSLLNGSDLSLIFIGREDCSFSAAQRLVFEEFLKKYDIEVNYLDLDTLSSVDLEILSSSYEEGFSGDSFATPTLMLVQNSEVKMFKKGYTKEDELLELFRENNFIE